MYKVPIPNKKGAYLLKKEMKSSQICQENIDFITDALFSDESLAW